MKCEKNDIKTMPIQTFQSNGALIIPITISTQNDELPAPSNKVNALIDTGATDHSVILNKLASKLGLVDIGKVTSKSIQGTASHSLYEAVISIPFDGTTPVEFPNQELVGVDCLPHDCEAILGWPILKEGLLIFNGPSNSFTLAF